MTDPHTHPLSIPSPPQSPKPLLRRNNQSTPSTLQHSTSNLCTHTLSTTDPLIPTTGSTPCASFPLLGEDPETVLRGHLQSIQLPHVPPDLSHLTVTFFNINTATRDKFPLLLDTFLRQQLDVLCVLDTRVWDPKDILWYKTTCLNRLGPVSSIHFAPAQPFRRQPTSSHDQVHTTAVGGQFIIKGSRISRTVGFRTDPSGCGAIATLHLIIGSADIDITSVYCHNAPTTVTTGGSLHSKIQGYLDSTGLPHVTPHSYIHNYISDHVTKHHRSNGSASIVGGDWNAAATVTDTHQGTNPPLEEWAASLHLINPYDTLSIPTTPTLFKDIDTAIGTLDHVLSLIHI